MNITQVANKKGTKRKRQKIWAPGVRWVIRTHDQRESPQPPGLNATCTDGGCYPPDHTVEPSRLGTVLENQSW